MSSEQKLRKNNSKSESGNGNWSKDEKEILKKFQPFIRRLIPLAVAFLAIFPYLVLTDKISLTPSHIKAENLKDFMSKLEFMLRYQIVGVFWMTFCLWYVISKRIPSAAINPLSGYEHLAEGAKNIMTNSLEQFIMSFVAQLSLITYLDGEATRKVIPMLNIMFLVGRITFWAGYPVHRSFGFLVTMWPTQITMWYTLSCFIEFVTGASHIGITWGIPLIFYFGWLIVIRMHRHKRF